MCFFFGHPFPLFTIECNITKLRARREVRPSWNANLAMRMWLYSCVLAERKRSGSTDIQCGDKREVVFHSFVSAPVVIPWCTWEARRLPNRPLPPSAPHRRLARPVGAVWSQPPHTSHVYRLLSPVFCVQIEPLALKLIASYQWTVN